jgi:hypothetical protein
MIAPDFFRDQATLVTASLRLEPLGPEHFDGSWAAINDPKIAASHRHARGLYRTADP